MSTLHPALTHLSEEEKLFRDSVLDFARKRIQPRAAAMDEAEHFDPELVPALHELGLMSIEVPEAYGGSGAGFLYNVVLAEELGRAGATGPGFVVHSDMVASYILTFGTDAQKKKAAPNGAAS